MIKVTEYCNLDCEYCFEKFEDKEHRKVFTKEQAKHVVEFLKNYKLDSRFEIKFNGGEISLIIPHLKQLMKIFRRLERYQDTQVYFSANSNGTNMDGILELIDSGYFDKDSVKISWDGIHTTSKSRHSKDPKYTDEYYNDQIIKLGKSLYSQNVLIRYAITKENVNDMYESFKFALANNCTKLEYYYLFFPFSIGPYYDDIEFLKKFEEQLYKIAELYIEHHFEYENWNSMIYSYYMYPNSTFLRELGCRHLGRMFYIDMLGRVAPCGFYTDDNYADQPRIFFGDIYNGLNEERIEEFKNFFKPFHQCSIPGCINLHCVECPASIQYKYAHGLRGMDEICKLRSIEKKVFTEMGIKSITGPIVNRIQRKYNISQIGPYEYT